MVQNQILNRKIIFQTVFLEIRRSFLNNLKLALGINRVTRNSPFFTVIQKQKTTKTIHCNFLLVLENLKCIANKSDSNGKALISNTVMV